MLSNLKNVLTETEVKSRWPVGGADDGKQADRGAVRKAAGLGEAARHALPRARWRRVERERRLQRRRPRMGSADASMTDSKRREVQPNAGAYQWNTTTTPIKLERVQ